MAIQNATLTLAKELRDNLDALGKYLVEELVKELIGNGHKATGSLINSIESEVLAFQQGLEVVIRYNRYGAYINNGVAAARVPFGGKSGKTTSLYIQSLIDWVKQKNIKQGVEAVGVAFAIARKHSKVGISTPDSKRFAPNGRRNGFQNYVLKTKANEIEKKIQDGLARSVSISLDNIITRIAA